MKARLVVMVVVLLLLTGSIAHSIESPEQQVLALIHEERAELGLSRLILDDDLSAVAESWSHQMLAEDNMYHNPDKQDQITDWTAIGENVGYGNDVVSIHHAFMRSTSHRENLLHPRWDSVGVGVAVGEDVWVTQVFRETKEAHVLSGNSGIYIDDHKISSAHRDAVYSLREQGFMAGFEDNSFRPQEPITREQFASILNNILENG